MYVCMYVCKYVFLYICIEQDNKIYTLIYFIYVHDVYSAEVAGDETLYASYLIAATRPVGKPLLLLLISLLCKPFVEMLLN